VVNGTEQCDDGNNLAGDCCSPTCRFEAAGSPCGSDDNVCTLDVCNATGVCTHPAGNAGTVCRAAAGPCDVAETCDGVSGACPADAKEPDGTSCALDACTKGATCIGGTCSGGTEVTCSSCKTCDPTNGKCVLGPRPSCAQPVKSGKAELAVKKSPKGPKDDQLLWNWVDGGATTTGDFGNPLGTDGLTFCVYDRSAAKPTLLFRADIAAGGTCGTKPCWDANRNKGFTFKNKVGDTSGGVVNLKLVAGEAGKAKIQLKGKGTKLSGRRFGLPSPPLDVPLTAQLQSQHGACWEARYSQSGLSKNNSSQFSGKAD